MTKINIKLLEQMAKNNIRQAKELHRRSGVSETVILEILNGKREWLSLKTVAKLCTALNCEIGDLIELQSDGQAS